MQSVSPGCAQRQDDSKVEVWIGGGLDRLQPEHLVLVAIVDRQDVLKPGHTLRAATATGEGAFCDQNLASEVGENILELRRCRGDVERDGCGTERGSGADGCRLKSPRQLATGKVPSLISWPGPRGHHDSQT